MEWLASRELLLAFTILNGVLMPPGLLFWLARTRQSDRLSLLLSAIAVTSFLALSGANESLWLRLSGYLRWVWVAGSVVALGAVLRRAATLRWRPQLTPLPSALNFMVLSVLAFALGSVAILYFADAASARAYEGEPVELLFPVVHERAVVMQGGASVTVNQHVAVPGQRYALDVIAMEPLWRRRARGVYPAELSEYIIYGVHVVAPCSGRVVGMANDRPDLTPPQADVEYIAGNHVLLHCDGNSVLLAHLQKGSVKVSLGQRVQAGQLVGFVGNSGNTSEPHLHVQAVEGSHTTMRELQCGKAAPMLFRGRFLVRGDVVDGTS